MSGSESCKNDACVDMNVDCYGCCFDSEAAQCVSLPVCLSACLLGHAPRNLQGLICWPLSMSAIIRFASAEFLPMLIRFATGLRQGRIWTLHPKSFDQVLPILIISVTGLLQGRIWTSNPKSFGQVLPILIISVTGLLQGRTWSMWR